MGWNGKAPSPAAGPGEGRRVGAGGGRQESSKLHGITRKMAFYFYFFFFPLSSSWTLEKTITNPSANSLGEGKITLRSPEKRPSEEQALLSFVTQQQQEHEWTGTFPLWLQQSYNPVPVSERDLGCKQGAMLGFLTVKLIYFL